MREETQQRLGPKFDEMMELFVGTSGAESYEKAIAMLRHQCQDKKTSPAPWVHKIAHQIYPADPPDSVDPEYFHEILALIDTREKARAVFGSLPEKSVPEIEKFFSFLLKDFYPSMRSSAQSLVTLLPQRRSGGRPPTKPNEDECRAICNEIGKLDRAGVKRGIAQQRIAQKYDLKLRMVQRIWAERGKYVEFAAETDDNLLI